MYTSWDRAAARYVEEWVPRFMPYHNDLIHELALGQARKVLVTSCGPGAEVVAIARALSGDAHIRATDASAEMVRLCTDHVRRAGFEAQVDCAQGDAGDTSGGPWDIIVSAFALWQIEDRARVVKAWGDALTPNGKIGVLAWGPPDPEDPFQKMSDALEETEPEMRRPSDRNLAERATMTALFEGAGLRLVRHTVTKHTLNFPKAEAMVRALREACAWRTIWEKLGDVRMDLVATQFYAKMGCTPDDRIAFDPPATIAIAAKPGAEIELVHRASVRVE